MSTAQAFISRPGRTVRADFSKILLNGGEDENCLSLEEAEALQKLITVIEALVDSGIVEDLLERNSLQLAKSANDEKLNEALLAEGINLGSFLEDAATRQTLYMLGVYGREGEIELGGHFLYRFNTHAGEFHNLETRVKYFLAKRDSDVSVAAPVHEEITLPAGGEISGPARNDIVSLIDEAVTGEEEIDDQDDPESISHIENTFLKNLRKTVRITDTLKLRSPFKHVYPVAITLTAQDLGKTKEYIKNELSQEGSYFVGQGRRKGQARPRLRGEYRSIMTKLNR